MDAAETLSCSNLGSCAQDAGNVPEKLLVDTSSDCNVAIWLQVLGNVPTHQYWTSNPRTHTTWLLQALAAPTIPRPARLAARVSECGCSDTLSQGCAGVAVANGVDEDPTI